MDLILVKNDNQNRVLNPKMIIKKAFLSRLMCKAWNIKKEKGLTLSKALKLAWVWAIKEATKKPKNQTLLF